MHLSNRSYPSPYDTAKADEIRATLKQFSIENFGESSLCDAHGDLIAAIGGNSPYLTRLIERDPTYFFSILSEDPKMLLQAELDKFTARENGETLTCLVSDLRVSKGHIALLTAIMDISGLWPLTAVTQALSDFASAAIAISAAHALHARMKSDELAWPRGKEEAVTPALSEGSGYVVLGLGKLGAGELNYSSDVDLIVLYDDMEIKYTGRKSPQDCFVKITQDLVTLMDKRTMDGYVFRTDLALRPDPGATPIALNMTAAEQYYHSLALNWERSAMIKAAVVGGDHSAGNAYLKRLSSWVWRRSMDYEALKDIHAIKNQILRHYKQEDIKFKDFNVKLGQGGIREIEFYAQVNQLVCGGKDVSLRTPATLQALDAIVAADLMKGGIRDDLKEAYEYLRAVEHRLQMINDEQTHSIPKQDDALERLAMFLGEASVDAFEKRLFAHCNIVKDHYDNLMPDTSEEPVALAGDRLKHTLEELAYPDVEAAVQVIEGWQRGRYKALRTPRARELLGQCLAGLLGAFAKTSEPSAALTRFDRFIQELPAGVQVFSLFQSNPRLFDLIARIMGLAPALADQLAKRPTLWEAVLDPHFFEPIPILDDLRAGLKGALAAAQDHQDILDITRRWVSEHRFQIGVHVLESIADVKEAGLAMTHLADATMMELIPAVEDDFSKRHGKFENGGIAVLAMGKYGGMELTYTSDLDVVFLYHVPDMDSQSSGERPLPPSKYFSRLGQTIITAITALTSEGRLFEVDTRLRPSGNAGPLVVTLETFADYYADPDRAWTWEHMALTRARIVVSPNGLVEPLNKTIHDTLTTSRDHQELLSRIAKMRERLAEQFTKDNMWSVKHARGGLVDMEFICQYLMLRHGIETNDIFSPILDETFDRLTKHSYLDKTVTTELKKAHNLQQTVQSIIRLCHGNSDTVEEDFSTGLKEILGKATGQKSFNNLKKAMQSAQGNVTKCYQSLIEIPYKKQQSKKDS